MSSRALRKAQREREELAKLQQLEQEENATSSEDEAPVAAPKRSAFAMLGEVDANERDDDDGDGLEEEEVEILAAQSIPIPAATKKSKKKKKKAKPKGDGGGDVDGAAHKDEDLDEIDRALEQLSTNGGAAATSGLTAVGIDYAVDETCQLLAIDQTHLHAQNEMRRLFGRAALEQDDDEAQQGDAGGGNRRQQRRQQMGLAQALRGQPGAGGRSAGLSGIALRRNTFIQGKEEWPAGGSGGLGMEVEEKRADGTVLFRFVHSTAYQDVQLQFESCVESMDPNRLIVLLQHNPYHISTLLQVSEIAKHESDPATSGDLLERALFSFGRAVHSAFGKMLAAGKARLDFGRPENREFWLASWRYMQNLSMRATWRTVYEWAKLLLSLSPEEDPYAMWLVLDQYALRSRQELDYLNLSRNATLQKARGVMSNVELSQGLAEVRSGNKSKGQQFLFKTIGRHPWVVARIMQEIGVDPPPGVWGKEPRTEKEKLYTELYATTAKDLWNTPEASDLLTEVASAIQPDTPCIDLDESLISQNEARHVLLSDKPALIALLPRSYTEALTSTSDPLPPTNNVETYSTAPPTVPVGAPRIRLAAALQQLFSDRVPTLESIDGLLNILRGNGGGEGDIAIREAAAVDDGTLAGIVAELESTRDGVVQRDAGAEHGEDNDDVD